MRAKMLKFQTITLKSKSKILSQVASTTLVSNFDIYIFVGEEENAHKIFHISLQKNGHQEYDDIFDDLDFPVMKKNVENIGRRLFFSFIYGLYS